MTDRITQPTHTLLGKESTKKYHIEYRGFLSNHLAHGVVALDLIGAPASRVQQWADDYATEKLEGPEQLPTDAPEITKFEEDLIGQRVRFSQLRAFYEAQISANGRVATVRQFFPKLCTGVVGSALHGLIHTGYTLFTESDFLLAEGLAYLHHSSVEFRPAERKDGGSLSILEAAEIVRQEGKLWESVIEHFKDKEQHKKWGRGNFQYAIDAEHLKLQEYIAEKVSHIKIPEKTEDFGTFAITTAIKVYATSAVKNDFLFIHGVTGAWSLSLVLPCLEEKDKVRALDAYLCTLVAVYGSVKCPELLPEDKLTFPENVDGQWWQDAKKKAWSEKYTDEHIFKLVQVVCELQTSEKFKDDQQQQKYFALAVHNCLEYPLDLPSYEKLLGFSLAD